MNSDYILKGRGQIALHQPDWARFTPSSGSRAASANVASPSAASAPVANSPLPTDVAQKSNNKAAANNSQPYQDTETENTRETQKTRFNNFTHSGSKKSVGPDVDTVDYTFEDFLDTINPLQQIPVVNMIYRHLTGDKISGVAQVMGSALFWGPTGIVTGAIDAMFEQEKGGDMGETIMASLLGTETPNAKNLPSNNPGRNPITNMPDTMLADAGEPVDEEAQAPVAIAAAKAAPIQHHKVATKQPFGGIMGNEQPATAPTVAESAANDVAEKPTPNAAPTQPLKHAPVDAEGHKLYSLAGVIRHVGSPSKMPIHEVPDARLKSYGKAATVAKEDPAALLGLQNPSSSIAALPSLNDDDMPATRLPNPGFSAPLDMNSLNMGSSPSGNPIPAQLIQDMMMMNMQKYQNDMKNGTLRGNSLDVNG